jgi:inositol oxygenase
MLPEAMAHWGGRMPCMGQLHIHTIVQLQLPIPLIVLQDDWMHLCGLLHDLGKVLAHPAFGSQPQWAVVGDTFPTGITPEPCVVYHSLFNGNPDLQDPRFQGPCGAYSPGCGLDKVRMSWGHDEYGYMVRCNTET